MRRTAYVGVFVALAIFSYGCGTSGSPVGPNNPTNPFGEGSNPAVSNPPDGYLVSAPHSIVGGETYPAGVFQVTVTSILPGPGGLVPDPNYNDFWGIGIHYKIAADIPLAYPGQKFQVEVMYRYSDGRNYKAFYKVDLLPGAGGVIDPGLGGTPPWDIPDAVISLRDNSGGWLVASAGTVVVNWKGR